MSDFKTKPNPGQPERCPSIDPHDTLQCARRIHEDDQCVAGGIGWKKGTPRYITDRERVELLGAEVRRLTLELDGARGLIHELRLSLAQAQRQDGAK